MSRVSKIRNFQPVRHHINLGNGASLDQGYYDALIGSGIILCAFDSYQNHRPWMDLNREFSYPCLIRHPRSLCTLWTFVMTLTVKKLEAWDDGIILILTQSLHHLTAHADLP